MTMRGESSVREVCRHLSRWTSITAAMPELCGASAIGASAQTRAEHSSEVQRIDAIPSPTAGIRLHRTLPYTTVPSTCTMRGMLPALRKHDGPA